jgi:hypothetical protein
MSHNQWFLNPLGDINLTDENYNTLLYNNIDRGNFSYLKTLGRSGSVHDYIRYNYNSHGYRSIKFEKTKDFLAAGCSQTFGVGVDEEFIWSNVLSKKLNVEMPNLSIVGGSIPSIINNLFAYFKSFGEPKTLFLFLPDPYRMQIPTQRKYITSDHIREEDPREPNPNYLTYLYLQRNKRREFEKYQKMPFDLESILTPDIPFLYSMRAIENLIQYCDNFNIKLMWSTHDMGFNSMMSDVKYKNYVDSEEHLWAVEGYYGKDHFGYEKFITTKTVYKGIPCHEELRNLDPRIFERGNDGSHYGIHQHYHIAEIFEKAFND